MHTRTITTENGERTHIIIARTDTKGKILSIEELGSGNLIEDSKQKAILSCTAYGEGIASVNMRHYIDVDDLLLLAKDIVDNRGATVNGQQYFNNIDYTEYKGTKNPNYPTGYESRQLSIKFSKELGKGTGGYIVALKAGAGRANESGAVMPVKDAETKSVNIVISVPAMRTLMLEVTNYYTAKMAAFMALNYKKLFP